METEVPPIKATPSGPDYLKEATRERPVEASPAQSIAPPAEDTPAPSARAERLGNIVDVLANTPPSVGTLDAARPLSVAEQLAAAKPPSVEVSPAAVATPAEPSIVQKTLNAVANLVGGRR